MTPTEFLNNFGEIANAPGSAARLRELILGMAMQGRLLKQEADDEPAVELSARLNEIKERLIAEKAIKRTAVEPDPTGHAREGLPPGWLWTRLGNAFDVRDGTHDTPKYTTEGFPLITSKNIYSGNLLFQGFNYISESDHRQISERSRVDLGDILFAMIGSIGNPVIVDTDREFSIKNLALFKYYSVADSEPRFLLLYLKLVAEAMRAKAGGGVQAFVSLGFLRNYPFPLPPLAEQKRIVAKVDELMALCDQLEAQQQERERRFPVLSRTCHARFAEAPTPANLNRIFDETGAVSPADLRKTIINFAVQGLLVNQDSTDEPASEACKRIQNVRLAAGEKDLGSLYRDEMPFEIPKGWCWIKMGNLALSSDSGWSPQCESTPRNGTNWGVLKVSAVSWDDFDPDENKALPAGMTPRPECEVHNGDFLLSRANTEELVARSVVVTTTPPHLMMSDKIVRFIFPEELEKRFINLANSAAFARSHYAKHASGTSSSMKNVGRGTMCNLPIPLPPIPEQRRIVAKVDELMALVNQLEAQQQERDKLAEAFAKQSTSNLIV